MAASVGLFVSWQLLAVFIINFILLVSGALRLERYDETVHWGWYVSVAVLYMVSMYGDLLHSLSSAQEAVKGLAGRTAVVVVFVVIFLMLNKLLKNKVTTLLIENNIHCHVPDFVRNITKLAVLISINFHNFIHHYSMGHLSCAD